MGRSTRSRKSHGLGFARLELPPQAGEVVIQGLEGPIRLFGVTLLKTVPGVVYHSLGLNGAYSDVIGRRFDFEQWREQIRHYHPDLIIINYGTNETGHGVFPEKWYEGVWKRALDRARDAAGETPLLVMSPMDVGTRGESGEITTLQALEQLMTVQRRVALAQNIPVYNTFLAMGGAGTMARWYASTPRLVSADYIHPTPTGARIVPGSSYKPCSKTTTTSNAAPSRNLRRRVAADEACRGRAGLRDRPADDERVCPGSRP